MNKIYEEAIEFDNSYFTSSVSNSVYQVIDKTSFLSIQIDNFLCAKTYSACASYFERELFNGHFELKGECYIRTLPIEKNNPFLVFYTKAMQDFFSQIFNIALNPDVISVLHHHPTGSKSGNIHTDYSMVRFANGVNLRNGINAWSANIDHHYSSTKKYKDATNVHLSARTIAIVYYLNNSAWEDGAGGETCFYLNKDGEKRVCISPENNRLLAFECTPSSFHGFVSNTKTSRNCLVMWYHEDPNTKVLRHGGVKLYDWGY